MRQELKAQLQLTISAPKPTRLIPNPKGGSCSIICCHIPQNTAKQGISNKIDIK